MLTRAGGRAASLAANDDAQHYFVRAAELADEPVDKARLLERAGATAWASGRSEDAQTLLEQALAIFQSHRLTHPAARVSARLGVVAWRRGQLEHALAQMESAFGVLSGDEPDEDLATLAAELGRLHFFGGNLALASERVDRAIEVAEALWLPEVLSQAMNTQGLIASWNGRPEQSLALFRHSLEIALEHDLTAAALRAYNNLGDLLDRRDRYEEAIEFHRRGYLLARKAGDRVQGWRLAAELAWCLTRRGDWGEALEMLGEIPHDQWRLTLSAGNAMVDIAVARGELDTAREVVESFALLADSADVQERCTYLGILAAVRRAEGRHVEVLEAGDETLAASARLGAGVSVDEKVALGELLESALALGRLELVEELVQRIESIPPGIRPPFLVAVAARFRSHLRARRGEVGTVEQGFKTAAAVLREHGLVFDLAVVLLEHGEWLLAQGNAPDAEPLIGEARQIFERLGATPWVARCDGAWSGAAATA